MGTAAGNARYSNASAVASAVFNVNFTDLSTSMKTQFGINADALGAGGTHGASSCLPVGSNILHNYIAGQIQYGVQYHSDRLSRQDGSGYTVLRSEVTTQEPVPVLAQLVIPNGDSHGRGTVIQWIGAYSARKLTLTSAGRKVGHCCDTDISNALSAMQGATIESLFPFLSFPTEVGGVLIDSKEFTYNLTDGSFTATMSCYCDAWCTI
jgi:hypothetical protein